MSDGALQPEIKSVVVANSEPFARACIAVLQERDGRDHVHKLKWRAFDVPVDVFDAARLRLRPGNKPDDAAARPAAVPQLDDVRSVIVGEDRALALACIDAWHRRDGRARRWMLDWKSINVPADVYADALTALGRSEAP